MTWISGFLTHKITTIYEVTLDKYGDRTRSTLYGNVPCRWVEKLSFITRSTDEIQRSTVEVWILPSYTIEEDYELVKDSKTYRVVGIEKRYDLSGKHDHTKLYLA